MSREVLVDCSFDVPARSLSMNHVPKRLVSTAARRASVSSSSSTFPPKESFTVSKDALVKEEFNPETWAALQPPPSTALSAFAHRIGLASILTSTDLIQQVCTHSSFFTLYRHHDPTNSVSKSNAQLSLLGNSLMGLFAVEYIHAKYPYLPTRVLKAAVTAHVGTASCASVAQEMGASQLLRWHRTPKLKSKPGVLYDDALASIPRSLTGLIYQNRSLPSARRFVDAYFLSRQVDIRSMLKFVEPKRALLEMVKKYDREPPKSRLLKETGRYSNSPVFVVGIFSGQDQIGEGFGSSLKMAEFRAAEDALARVYLTRTPDDLIQLPSSTFPLGLGDVYRADAEAKVGEYTAPDLVVAEPIYESSGKSRSKPLSQS